MLFFADDISSLSNQFWLLNSTLLHSEYFFSTYAFHFYFDRTKNKITGTC